jgi:AraC family transcriptional regulator of adaptative response/methylated-DNA-[protein]-cysteine methyltransferase
MSLPSGTTTTYGDLARDLGAPTASRAVAGAVAANRVAVVIPCHRVIRTGGALGGYRWGLARKRALVDAEAAFSAAAPASAGRAR